MKQLPRFANNMVNELTAARQIAESVRYVDDLIGNGGPYSAASSMRQSALRNNLRISSDVTPGLDRIIARAMRRLRLPPYSVEAFVYSGSEHQASCIDDASNGCILTLSSGMVELLEPEELTFVVGHEVGHFLLRHRADLHSDGTYISESMIANQQSEISADRVGLIACASLDVAIWTLMKIFSGLSAKHLHFNVAEFVAQLGDVVGGGNSASLSTHPSMLIRSRALLWFSMSSPLATESARSMPDQDDSISTLDERIRRDISQYGDGDIRFAIENAESDVRLWAAATIIVKNGNVHSVNRDALGRLVGTEDGDKMIEFLSMMSRQEAIDLVSQRLDESVAKLEIVMPTRAEAIFAQAQKSAMSALCK